MPIEPGIYRELSNKDYHADPALSNSMMQKLYKDPEYLKAYLDSLVQDTTRAFIFGSPFHCKVLQPHLFDTLFVIWPHGHKRNKKELEEVEQNGQEWVKEVDLVDIDGMIEVIKNDEVASGLLSGGEAEVSYFWRHPKYGFMCKCRPDYRKGNIIVELKTTKDSSEEGFPWEMGKYGYCRQGDHYLCGVAANKVETEHFMIIAQEKKPPYIVKIYWLQEDDLYLGHLENELVYQKFSECLSTQAWKEPSKIRPISLPQKFVKNAKI